MSASSSISSKPVVGASSAAMLRLMSDLANITREPPDVCYIFLLLCVTWNAHKLHTLLCLPFICININILKKGASARPTNESNMFNWTASVFGPPETIWEGILLTF